MWEWCRESPFLTFFLVLAALGTVDTVAKALGGKWRCPKVAADRQWCPSRKPALACAPPREWDGNTAFTCERCGGTIRGLGG